VLLKEHKDTKTLGHIAGHRKVDVRWYTQTILKMNKHTTHQYYCIRTFLYRSVTYWEKIEIC